jgi:hypothetical protein
VAQGAEDFHDDREIARLTLQLDEAITLRRRAGVAWLSAHSDALPALPIKPSRVELAVLTVLAQAYGAALLQEDDFALVLDRIAERGAVVLVQRALWGERPDDIRLAARLLDARIPFEILCGTWPEVFMAQALAELHRFSPQPPGSSAAIDDAGADDD